MHPPFPWFVAVAVDTRPGPPLAPDSPEVSASSKGLSLSWREPPTQGAAVSSYVVQVCQLSVLQGGGGTSGAAPQQVQQQQQQQSGNSPPQAAIDEPLQRQGSSISLCELLPMLLPGAPQPTSTGSQPSTPQQLHHANGHAKPQENSVLSCLVDGSFGASDPHSARTSDTQSVQSEPTDSLFLTVYQGVETSCMGERYLCSRVGRA
jgi:hypothetical protein